AEDDILIGTIGRLQEGKGHIEFLEMAARIAAEFAQARFIIVGEATRGEEHRAEKIYRKIEQINLGQRLILAGFRKDVPAVLAAMDIFAFPSRAEAFGLVIIEAMAAGVPVVSTRSDGVLDIVEDGVNGILVDRQQVDQLTAAVRTCILDENRRKELIAAGRKTIAEKFTVDRMVSETEKVYQECL
ncbi:MAG TPA: glycosyltransferase family 1 protein, partial [Planctomycetaceae bacterium]|nr:glycosyltransferase family 1 protein [Planctomycetaceae bacterium]